MADLPELKESIQRTLEIRWNQALVKHGLTGPHLLWHVDERNRLRRIAAQMGSSIHSGGSADWKAESAVDHIGVPESEALAEERFRDLCPEYWRPWLSTKTQYDCFVDWLGILQLQVLEELKSVWDGGSKTVQRWFRRAGAPAVKKALDTLVDEWTKQAQNAELKREGSNVGTPAGKKIEEEGEGRLSSENGPAVLEVILSNR